MKFGPKFAATVLAILFVRATSGHEIQYSALLSGAAEAPPNGSAGTGTGLVTIDLDFATLRVESSFSGLSGTVTAAHIHCCTAEPGMGTVGVATPTPTFPGFPSGVTSGNYNMTFDLSQASSYNAAFITANGGTVSGAMNALLAGLATGSAYLNIHTTQFPGGEIRGFPVPEPTTWSMLLMGLSVTACFWWGRLRRKVNEPAKPLSPARHEE